MLWTEGCQYIQQRPHTYAIKYSIDLTSQIILNSDATEGCHVFQPNQNYVIEYSINLPYLLIALNLDAMDRRLPRFPTKPTMRN